MLVGMYVLQYCFIINMGAILPATQLTGRTAWRNRILALYQVLLPDIQNSEVGWQARQHRLRAYRDDTLVEDDSVAHFRLVSSPKGKRLLNQMMTTTQHYSRYQDYKEQGAKIIRMIDAYPGMEAQGH